MTIDEEYKTCMQILKYCIWFILGLVAMALGLF